MHQPIGQSGASGQSASGLWLDPAHRRSRLRSKQPIFALQIRDYYPQDVCRGSCSVPACGERCRLRLLMRMDERYDEDHDWLVTAAPSHESSATVVVPGTNACLVERRLLTVGVSVDAVKVRLRFPKS